MCEKGTFSQIQSHIMIAESIFLRIVLRGIHDSLIMACEEGWYSKFPWLSCVYSKGTIT